MHNSLKQRLDELDGQEERLLDLAGDGSIPQEKIKIRLRRIQVERDRANEGLLGTHAELGVGANALRTAISFMSDPHTMYSNASDDTRRLMNQTFYQRFYIDEEISIRGTLSNPFNDFHQAAKQRTRDKISRCAPTPTPAKHTSAIDKSLKNQKSPLLEPGIFSMPGSSNGHLVELRGLEPLTPTRGFEGSADDSTFLKTAQHLRR
ncbi:hypothetical protein OG203_15820 [Nocardia sp. NBC_01499]|uniref:hypothetical protein n=1 Tax=Nocardia sp. NBC_01499 TaxID=2903597 RepID=UPI003863AEF3